MPCLFVWAKADTNRNASAHLWQRPGLARPTDVVNAAPLPPSLIRNIDRIASNFERTA
jgi:hypothetical protein